MPGDSSYTHKKLKRPSAHAECIPNAIATTTSKYKSWSHGGSSGNHHIDGLVRVVGSTWGHDVIVHYTHIMSSLRRHSHTDQAQPFLNALAYSSDLGHL